MNIEMSDFDYSLDVDEGFQASLKEDELQWDNSKPASKPAPGPICNSRRFNSGRMNAQYSEAYGDYRGGYGPGGGFGSMRPRPYPPCPPQGGVFGPIGQPPQHRHPLMHRAGHFLAKCGISPQYIKPLPWQLLDLIAPDFCALCNIYIGSFALAKIHYNSKNHYKAQKKFLMMNNLCNNQNYQNYQLPLKSRNLYCELCDVQITSTSHANSHYAGKSHRAIVEGRKPPKNAILLQEGMESRVDQLIRREKKNNKSAVDASAEAPEEKVKTVNLDKNVPSELFCDICKTSVTCSEQMTNHLNGKKHLTKEKQHILNMMKGKSTKNEDEEVEVEANTADVEEEAEQQSGTDLAKHEADWTTGSGADWDTQDSTEPPPTQIEETSVPAPELSASQ